MVDDLKDDHKELEQEKKSYGQRRMNMIWELTQALIAIIVSLSTVYVAARLSIYNNADMAAFLLLSNAFFLVIGFYFSRTNHARLGDADKEDQK